MPKWNIVEAVGDCGYDVDQHVLESKTVSAKVWRNGIGDVHLSFDTDDSPNIQCEFYLGSDISSDATLELAKLFVTQVLAPKYDKKNY